MMRGTTTCVVTLAACLLGIAPVADAQDESAFAGEWMVSLELPPADIVALLQIERRNGEWAGWLEGGPVSLDIDGRRIEVIADSRDIAGFVIERRLVGTLSGSVIEGTLSIVGNDASPENGTSWHAMRVARDANTQRQPPQPVDLSGIWVPGPGVDFRKYSMDLTPEAEAWHADYLFHLDQPNVRCVSPGLVALIGWSGYPQEWLQDDNRLTMLFEVGSEVRRVYLDGREFPDFFPMSPMGFSVGHWDGSDLVVDTRMLSPNVRDFRGEPISENARLVERYELSEDGNMLSAVITLHDPENYERPPIRRRSWVRDPEAEIYPYECDPDSFFRQLHEEGRMQEYMDRAHRRF